MGDTIRMEGIRELQGALRKMDADLPKELRLGFNDVAGIVVDYARPRFPTRTGRAAGSVRAQSSQRGAGVAEGGRRAPYAPWLDFGGAVGPNRSVKRRFERSGRYVWAGVRERREEIQDRLEKVLTDVARGAGLDVTHE